MHMPAQELAQIQTMVIAVRCHGIGERDEAVSMQSAHAYDENTSRRWERWRRC